MPVLATHFLERAPTPQAAYVGLQAALMRRFVARGGTAAEWCERCAPAFRRRYGWMVGESGVTRRAA